MTHRILSVEDDKHFAAQLKELFDYHGLEARVAVTGTGGIEDFERFGADLVLIDVMLPQVHGLRVLEDAEEPRHAALFTAFRAGIEAELGNVAKKARDGTLSIADMQGGTFTITNGGVYGSLMSTPILNPPQSGVLGMHRIEQRPVAVDGQVVIRPMMYLALSYDHRIVDGKGAVTFLVRVKEALEDPRRLLMDL